ELMQASGFVQILQLVESQVHEACVRVHPVLDTLKRISRDDDLTSVNRREDSRGSIERWPEVIIGLKKRVARMDRHPHLHGSNVRRPGISLQRSLRNDGALRR